MPFFSKHSHYRSLITLGLPIMVGQLGIILVGFVDNIMVGHHSTPELAAASFVNNFMNLAFILGVGFSYGLTPLVSASHAAGDGQVRRLLRSSLVSNAIVGGLLMLIMGGFWLHLDVMSQPEELMPYIRPYYLIQLSTILVTMLFNALKQFSDGVERAKEAMFVLLGSNLVNIVLNYLLIFGKWGLPELGLIGAGLATLTARLFCLVVLGLMIRRGRAFRRILSPCAEAVEGYRLRSDIRRLFRLGIPISMQMGVEAASFSLSVIIVGWLGSVSLASHQVMSVVSTLGFMLYYGLSSAVTIRVSGYYQQCDVKNIRAVVRAGFHLLLVMTTTFVSFLLLFRSGIGRIFTTDEEIIAKVSLLCIPMVFYQFGDIVQILFANVLRGLRDVKYMAVCACLCHLLLALSLCYTFAIVFDWGVIGVWCTYPFSLTTLGILLYFRYRRVIAAMDCR